MQITVLYPAVDEAIRALSAAIQTGDQTQIDSYRDAFSERIDQLEEFYLHHDDGPWADPKEYEGPMCLTDICVLYR